MSNLQLGAIGNSSVGALVDARRRDRLGLPAALRRRRGVLLPAARAPRARPTSASRAWSSSWLDAHRAGVPAQHPHPRDAAVRRPRRRASRSSTSRRASASSGASSAPPSSCASSGRIAGSPRIRVRMRPADDYGRRRPEVTSGLQPHPLRRLLERAAPHHGLLHHRDPGGDALRPARRHLLRDGARRDAAGKSWPRWRAASSSSPRTTGTTGCATSPSPSSGRTRSSARPSRSSSPPTTTRAR